MDPRQSSLLFIDGYCAFCVRTGRFVAALDSFRRIRVVSFRHDDSYELHGLQLAALHEEIHLVVGEKVFRGFEALVEIAKKVPWLWPTVPVLLLMDRMGLGAALYRKVAASRTLSLDGRHCNVNETCRT